VSAFRDEPKKDGSGKRDINFNDPDQADRRIHGHVTQREDEDGTRSYNYVRDHVGDPYIDDNPRSSTYTGPGSGSGSGSDNGPTVTELQQMAERDSRRRRRPRW